MNATAPADVVEIDPEGRAMARLLEACASPRWTRESRVRFGLAFERAREHLSPDTLASVLWSQLVSRELHRGPTLAERRELGAAAVDPELEQLKLRCQDWLAIPDPDERDRLAGSIARELGERRSREG